MAKDLLRFLLEEIIEVYPGRSRRELAESGKDSEGAVGIVALRCTAG